MNGAGRVIVHYLAAIARRVEGRGPGNPFPEMAAEIGAEFDAAGRHLDALEKRIVALEALHGKRAAHASLSPHVDELAAAALEREIDIEPIADELVAELFRNGQGNEAARLMLVDRDGRELAGWAKGPVRDRVLEALRKATPAPAAVLEAVAADETIPRLALAFRAIAADHERDGGELYEFAWKIADYLEKPDEALEAIKRAGERSRRSRRTR